jgi:plastocyanin
MLYSRVTARLDDEAPLTSETPDMNATLLAATLGLTLTTPILAVAQQDHQAGHAAQPAAATTAPKTGQPIEISVTSEGFVPASIKVQKGQKVRLVVTRKVERTCATEIVIKDQGINQPLPLNKPVTIEFTPGKSGQIRYACGMDMISGVIVVE